MPKPTREQLQRYVDQQAIQRSIETKARSVDAEMHSLADVLLEYLEDRCTDVAMCYGYELRVQAGAAHVDWHEEYIAESGEASATVIEQNAPHPPKLIVTPPQAKR